MADVKITGLGALAAQPADGDLIEIVDISDTSMDAAGTNKKIEYWQLRCPRYVYPASTESVNSSGTGTTLQDDDELLVTVAANTIYAVEAYLFFTSASDTPDVKVRWTFPTAATLTMSIAALSTDVTDEAFSGRTGEASPSTTLAGGVSAATGAGPFHMIGMLRTGANAGTLQLQWAQNSSSATNLTRTIDSFIRYTRLT